MTTPTAPKDPKNSNATPKPSHAPGDYGKANPFAEKARAQQREAATQAQPSKPETRRALRRR